MPDVLEKGERATIHVNGKAQYQATVLGGYPFLSMQTERHVYY